MYFFSSSKRRKPKKINHILYIIAEAERKWIPTIKEVVTNRKKRPLEMLPRIQL